MSTAVYDRIRTALEARQRKSLSHLESYAPAGVLLLHYEKGGSPHILFTKRTSRVEHHKGEISFPGGARDPQDASVLATALRETAEELGVQAADVEVLGGLDDITTFSSRFVISPFVGTIPQPYIFRPSPVEIAEVLEVPVAALLDPANVRVDRPLGGANPMYSYVYQDSLIWGATARILKQFLDLVYS